MRAASPGGLRDISLVLGTPACSGVVPEVLEVLRVLEPPTASLLPDLCLAPAHTSPALQYLPGRKGSESRRIRPCNSSCVRLCTGLVSLTEKAMHQLQLFEQGGSRNTPASQQGKKIVVVTAAADSAAVHADGLALLGTTSCWSDSCLSVTYWHAFSLLYTGLASSDMKPFDNKILARGQIPGSRLFVKWSLDPG